MADAADVSGVGESRHTNSQPKVLASRRFSDPVESWEMAAGNRRGESADGTIHRGRDRQFGERLVAVHHSVGRWGYHHCSFTPSRNRTDMPPGNSESCIQPTKSSPSSVRLPAALR